MPTFTRSGHTASQRRSPGRAGASWYGLPRSSRRATPIPPTARFRQRKETMSRPRRMASELGSRLTSQTKRRRSGRRSRPFGAGAKSHSRGRSRAGLALLAGAAGLAMKNRDKISRMMHRSDTSAERSGTTPPVG